MTSHVLFVLALCLVAGLLVGGYFRHSYPGELFAPYHQLVVRDNLKIWARISN